MYILGQEMEDSLEEVIGKGLLLTDQEEEVGQCPAIVVVDLEQHHLLGPGKDFLLAGGLSREDHQGLF